MTKSCQYCGEPVPEGRRKFCSADCLYNFNRTRLQRKIVALQSNNPTAGIPLPPTPIRILEDGLYVPLKHFDKVTDLLLSYVAKK